MYVIGYDDHKDTFEVDLSVEEIVEAGLDPWRVDLFDPDPVSIVNGSQRLFFRRLRDIAFKYPLEGDKEVIGLWDESGQVCVVAGCSALLSCDTIDSSMTGCSAFKEHFSKFLTCCQRKHSDADVLGSRYGAVSSDYVYLLNRRAIFSRYTRGVIKTGNQVYVGEMFSPIKITIPKLPSEIARVFEDFDGCNPLVYGDSLTLAVLGQTPINLVKALVNKAGIARAIARFDARRGNNEVCYEVDGCGYDLRLDTDGHGLDTLMSYDVGFSVEGMYSSQPTELCGIRVGLYDMSLKQARRISYNSSGFQIMVPGLGLDIKEHALSSVRLEANSATYIRAANLRRILQNPSNYPAVDQTTPIGCPALP